MSEWLDEKEETEEGLRKGLTYGWRFIYVFGCDERKQMLKRLEGREKTEVGLGTKQGRGRGCDLELNREQREARPGRKNAATYALREVVRWKSSGNDGSGGRLKNS
eukprot:TRINITY_DN1385_c0_g1_i3.p1 TRINITY_DN1385_c0_g1~~TRINITY_DN1385_c0_g1_i3.p1  ORF type:complete len:106 (-),score=20.51 TRINITY_DN1385_c0_g1_i3:255-572(-)